MPPVFILLIVMVAISLASWQATNENFTADKNDVY